MISQQAAQSLRPAYSQQRYKEQWVEVFDPAAPPGTRPLLARVEVGKTPHLGSTALEGETQGEAEAEAAESPAGPAARRRGGVLTGLAAEFLDAPFVPRLDDTSTSREEQGVADEEGDVFFNAPEELPEGGAEAEAEADTDAGEEEAARIAAAAAAAARAAAALPVGMVVVVQHLAAAESALLNGCLGIIASPMLRESGRQAVRTVPRARPS